MDLRSDLPFWTLKNGIIATYPPLNQDISCDIAIVGGGITGALVGYYLIEEGIDTVIIDKRDFGFGSTSASTGLLQYENDNDLRLLIDLVGEEAAVTSYRLCRDAIQQIEANTRHIGAAASFTRMKSLYVASQKQHVANLEEEYRVRRKHGFKLKFLARDELHDSLGVNAQAAILSPGSAQIDPYKFCHDLLKYCTGKGLKAFDRTGLSGYRPRGRKVVLDTDRGYTVTARKVVLASGYEAQDHLKQKVVSLKSTYAVASEPVEGDLGILGSHLIWETARPYIYARSTRDNRIIFGGGDEAFVSGKQRDAAIGRKTASLVSKLGRFLPEVAIEPAFSWAGTFGGTKDGLPYIGETQEFPNAYFALGYGGNGMTFSIIASEIIRDLYLRRKNPNAAYYRFDR